MNFLRSKTVLFLFVLFVNSAEKSYAQNECTCDRLSKNEKLELLSRNDSLEVYEKIAELKAISTVMCTFESLQLEFDFFLADKKSEGLINIIEKQKRIVNTSKCFNQFNYYLYYNQASYYRTKNNFERLSEFAFKALKEAELLKDDEKKILVIKQIVFLFTRMKENAKRWSYVKQAEKLILNSKDGFNTVANYRWLGYQYENQYTKTERQAILDSTIIFINRAKQGALEQNLTKELALIYRAFEACAYHKGELENALKYIDSAIYYAKNIKGKKNISGLYLSKSWDHYDLKQFDEASMWMDTALFYDNKSKDALGHMMLLSEASQIYEGSGNLNKAMSALKEHSKLKDSVLSKQRSKAINELETEYRTDLKDAKIERLTVLLIATLFGIVSIILVSTLIRLRQSKKQNDALKIAFEKQIALENELSDVRDEIAQDFHDDLGNKLARISLLSNLVSGEVSLDNPKVKSKIKQITEDANGLYNGTRDFVFSLKSKSDYIEEVVTYLSDFGENFFKKTKIKFVVNKQINVNDRLPHYWNKHLIFIFKEALTNALKHSKCDEVKLSFLYANNVLTISCYDNGIGFSNEDKFSSNGLVNMKNRALKIGGELNIVSNNNDGTTIIFTGNVLEI